MLKLLFLIFIGGGLGSIIRYGLGYGLNTLIPYGTFAANILGCFLIGLFLALSEKHLLNHRYYVFLVVGFCGGFTTFSSFAAENLKMIQNGQISLFLLYMVTSLIAGIFMVWVGYKFNSLV